MGRRKRKGVFGGRVQKKRAKLDKVFNCPFCQTEKCVECELDRGRGKGILRCQRCGAGYSKSITHLDEEIDVFATWIDECMEASKVNDISQAHVRASAHTTTSSHLRKRRKGRVYDEDFEGEELDLDDSDNVDNEDEVQVKIEPEHSQRSKPTTRRKSRKRSVFDSDYEDDDNGNESESDIVVDFADARSPSNHRSKSSPRTRSDLGSKFPRIDVSALLASSEDSS